uniref:Uncharacterized protein n=1 Tax=Eucampia antarctica TaxID=49252 RepID=A0A6U0PKS0_9STRA|mmetsp:Transcript_12888/g.12504  ORF Transcript_12888/g.12504 Transcript_12888/m.12504 type:complete len:240 (+) Transcript_12888:480-1199(+)
MLSLPIFGEYVTSKPLRSFPSTFCSHFYSQVRPYAVFRFPWNCTQYTPVFTGIPPHVVVMSDLEASKNTLGTQTNSIMAALNSELNNRGVGGEGFQARAIFEEMKSPQGSFLEQMNSLLASGATSGQHSVASSIHGSIIPDCDSNFIVATANNEHNEDDVDTTRAVDHEDVTVNDEESPSIPRGVLIQWKNCEEGKFCLVAKTFRFPKGMTLSTLFCIYYNRDRRNNIPPYRMLSQTDL